MDPELSPAAITFDVYSALIDSRTGATAAFAELGKRHRWGVRPEEVYRRWDEQNKALQRDTPEFVSFRELAQAAMTSTYAALHLEGDAPSDTAFLLSTMPRWPHYDDVPDAVARMARRYPVALLSNIDDDLLERSNPGFPFRVTVTSEQARCYKPHPGIYRYAEARLGAPLLHVPASARDVRGALDAGIAIARVRRPGHVLDAEGPRPELEVDDLRELADLLA